MKKKRSRHTVCVQFALYTMYLFIMHYIIMGHKECNQVLFNVSHWVVQGCL